MPPVALSVELYAVLTVPDGNVVELEIPRAGAVVRSENAAPILEDVESVTEMVGVALTALVGVPEMTPVAAFSVSPAGSAPAVTDQV